MNGVLITPGLIEFTRIPSRASSVAALWVNPRTAHLLDTYGASIGVPTWLEEDATFTIEPPPARLIDGAAARMPRYVPRRLVAMI